MDDNIKSFLKVMDPADNSTGGGTASAVGGAMAASLVAMVARLSKGKEGLEPESFYEGIRAEAERLATELFDGAHKDSQSFEAVTKAFKMPKKTDEEKPARKKAIQAGWITATRLPLANAKYCGRVIELGTNLRKKFNQNAKSDLECALYLARAGMMGCLANVEINLPSIKDKNVVKELSDRADDLRKLLEGE